MPKTKIKISNTAYILGLIIGLQLIGMIFYFRFSNTLHASSQKEIDSLIGEIGDLKQENEILNQKVTDQAQENQLNEATLKQLYLQFASQQQNSKNLQNDLTNYQNFLESERRRLNAEANSLNNQLDQKEKKISELSQEKENKKQFDSLNQKLITVLLLGTNQKLTDSIQLAIVDPEKQKNTLISIPRDLFYDGRKINEYYEFYGIDKTKEIVQKITGLEIDKYVVFNFQSFKDLVDTLGGIDINVEKKIVDNEYPTASFGYKTVVFNPGLQKMSGENALEYARSRKSTSDFDRSKRQQQIIAAIEQKLLSMGVMKNIQFFVTAFQNIQSNLNTNLNALEAIQLFDQYKNYQLYAGNVLSNENFLYSSKSITGQSILLPLKGNFLAFQSKLLEII